VSACAPDVARSGGKPVPVELNVEVNFQIF
jgi:hypothetical protein